MVHSLSHGPIISSEIRRVARRTINILVNHVRAKNVCLIGSAASALWADIKRVPNDVDILVTPDKPEHSDIEAVKRSIVKADDRYYLVPSKRPRATYKKLWCRLPGWEAYHRRRVKVDVLIAHASRLWIPQVPSPDAVLINNIPVSPLFDLLVIKIQGFRDHAKSRRSDFQAKVEADITDIRALLDRAMMEEISYQNEKHHHTRNFMNRARKLARLCCRAVW
ncbi:hypothetical protein BC827DRAFT_1131405 [Russula dissimulans]|nr:hypothetical protein BC827DRAFT_1131405 [Russula dissimulans]